MYSLTDYVATEQGRRSIARAYTLTLGDLLRVSRAFRAQARALGLMGRDTTGYLLRAGLYEAEMRRRLADERTVQGR